MLNFLKWIGIIPQFNNLFVSMFQMIVICLLGIFSIYFTCKKINKNLQDIEKFVDKEVTNWEKNFLKKLLWKYPLWGFIQQLVMIIIFYFIKKIIVTDWIAIAITSLIFAGLHYPNIYLGLAVFGMEQLLLNYLLLYHNLYFIGFIHGFLGTSLLYFSPSIIYTRFSTWKNYWELYK